MKAFVVTMSALGNEGVLTVGSLCNSKWTRIINLPHTLLHFRNVGGPDILFFDHDVIDDVTGQHPVCILRNSTAGRRLRFLYFFLLSGGNVQFLEKQWRRTWALGKDKEEVCV
jgi:hypothetical protein